MATATTKKKEKITPIQEKEENVIKAAEMDEDLKETCEEETTEEVQGPSFEEEAMSIPVPTSVAANNFRQQINNAIQTTPLHIEIVLEILRSAVDAVSAVATQTAQQEASEYYSRIEQLQNKHNK